MPPHSQDQAMSLLTAKLLTCELSMNSQVITHEENCAPGPGQCSMLSTCIHLDSETAEDLHTSQVKFVGLREVLLASWNVPVPLYTLHDSHQGN